MWGERAMENSGTVSSYSAHKNNYSNGYQSNSRTTVDTLLRLLFVQNYSQNMEKKSITVLSSTPVCLLCYNYLSCTKLLEGGLLSEHV